MTDQPQTTSDAQITRKTFRGTAWTYLSFLLSKGVNLLTTVILARLLTQADFGIVGFAVTAMSFFDAVRALGMDTAIVQRRSDIEEASQTAFWLNLGSNTLIWLVLVVVSPLVANFFHEPLITIILPVLSFSFIISSAGSIQDGLLRRDMSFRRRLIPGVGESVVKLLISAALALLGGGVWALVIGQLAGRATYSVLAWRMVSWRPRWQFSRKIARELISFGSQISLDGFLSALQANIDYVFVGRFLGEVTLGVYTIAFRVPEMIIINMCLVVAEVLFPAYSMVQHDLDQLRRVMLSMLRYISLITMPVGIGLALTAIPITRVLFGPKWDDAGPTMAILCLYGTALAISWNIGDVYKAIGRADILWKTSVVEFGLLGSVLYVMAHYSAFYVAIGHFTVALIVTTLRLAIASGALKVRVRDLLSQLVPSLVGSLLMGVAVWLTLTLTGSASDLIKLICAIPIGAAVYIAAMWWFEPKLMRTIWEKVQRMISPKVPMETDLVEQ